MRHVDHVTAERSGENTILRARKHVSQEEALISFAALPAAPVNIFPGTFYFEVVRQCLLWLVGEEYDGFLDLAEVKSVRYAVMADCGDDLHMEAVVAPLDRGRPIDVRAEFRKPGGQLAARMSLEFDGGGQGTDGTPAIGPAEFLRWIPYADPMILVDRVVRHDPGKSIETLKAISNSDPVFRRRPDGGPLVCYAYPAGLVLNSWGQSAALLVKALPGGGGTVLTASARGFRTYRKAYPGDVLRNLARLDEVRYGSTFFVSGSTFVGADMVASGSVVMTVQGPAEKSTHDLRVRPKEPA
jgi:3-hydroxyacyl-[acyl-carrier-protein] dehydratase